MSIKIENVVLPSPAQMEAVIRGMRNPMNSWDKSDSGMGCTDRTTLSGEEHGVKMCKNCGAAHDYHCSCNSNSGKPQFIIGKDDLKLMKSLVEAGSDHSKFMRMITVYAGRNTILTKSELSQIHARLCIRSGPRNLRLRTSVASIFLVLSLRMIYKKFHTLMLVHIMTKALYLARMVFSNVSSFLF